MPTRSRSTCAGVNFPLFDPLGGQSSAPEDEDSTDTIPMLGMLLPQLGHLRHAASLLQFHSLHQLETGSTTGVIADIRAIVGLARHTGEQGSLISQLVRISINTVAVQTAVQLLAHAGESLTDEDLVTLDTLFNPAIVGNLCSISLTGERRLLWDTEQHIDTDTGHGNGRLHSELMMSIMDDDLSFGGAMSPLLAAPISAVMPDRKSFHAQVKQLFDAADRDREKPMWERDISELRPLYRRLESSLWEQTRWSILLMILPAIERTFTTADIAAMQRDAIRATIALFRFKRAEHRWPADLNALIPTYLDTLPIDRFDGKPLRYRLGEHGEPTLYSISSDLDDDLGAPAFDDDGWPTLDGADHWIPPSQVAVLKADAPPGRERLSRILANGDMILWPPLPDKPVEPEPADPYPAFP